MPLEDFPNFPFFFFLVSKIKGVGGGRQGAGEGGRLPPRSPQQPGVGGVLFDR